ncbi:MAG: phage tail protein [Vicinamibacterales bacterium]
MITVQIDDREVQILATDAPGRIQRAIVRALNRSIGAARTAMIRAVAQDTGLKSRDVREALTLTKATTGIPAAALAASLKRIPLVAFNARGPEPSRGKGRGVSYRLPGSVGRNPNAFLATMKSGHRGVFIRASALNNIPATHRRPRLPLIELHGPSVSRPFLRYRSLGEAKAEEAFLSNFEHELVFSGTEPTGDGGTSE